MIHSSLPGLFYSVFTSEKESEGQYSAKQRQEWIDDKNRSLQQSLQIWAREYLPRPNACSIYGQLLYHLEEYDAALACYQRCSELCGPLEEQPLASAYNNMGLVHYSRGDYQQAIDYYNDSQEIFEIIKDRQGYAATLNNIGMVYRDWGKDEQAREHIEQALAIAREIGDQEGWLLA